jgi:hypothetical protein
MSAPPSADLFQQKNVFQQNQRAGAVATPESVTAPTGHGNSKVVNVLSPEKR